MFPRVTSVRPARDLVLFLTFADGASGEVDLTDELDAGVFLPLRDPALFRQARLDAATHTVVWPNGADFAPEFLRDRLRATVATA
jgi:hypothetical protein